MMIKKYVKVLSVILGCYAGLQASETTSKEKINQQLFKAIGSSHATVVDTLLDQGADVNAVLWSSRESFTPLHVVIKNGHLDKVKLLLQRGADKE